MWLLIFKLFLIYINFPQFFEFVLHTKFISGKISFPDNISVICINLQFTNDTRILVLVIHYIDL